MRICNAIPNKACRHGVWAVTGEISKIYKCKKLFQNKHSQFSLKSHFLIRIRRIRFAYNAMHNTHFLIPISLKF